MVKCSSSGDPRYHPLVCRSSQAFAMPTHTGSLFLTVLIIFPEKLSLPPSLFDSSRGAERRHPRRRGAWTCVGVGSRWSKNVRMHSHRKYRQCCTVGLWPCGRELEKNRGRAERRVTRIIFYFFVILLSDFDILFTFFLTRIFFIYMLDLDLTAIGSRVI